ncbi:MAG: hypothetical protein JSV68_15230 [Anaerolineaceae bacterium]|nr:MAG: hypothetical protein JSV68_15230 [Anaerolineaceae bacterium]
MTMIVDEVILTIARSAEYLRRKLIIKDMNVLKVYHGRIGNTITAIQNSYPPVICMVIEITFT